MGSEFEFMNMAAAIAKALMCTSVNMYTYNLNHSAAVPLRGFQPEYNAKEVRDDHRDHSRHDKEDGYDP